MFNYRLCYCLMNTQMFAPVTVGSTEIPGEITLNKKDKNYSPPNSILLL